MATARLHLSFRPSPATEARLHSSGVAATWPDDPGGQPRDELMADVAGADGLACLLTDRIDAKLLDAAGPGLTVVANMAVGYDNIDLDACAHRGIIVTNTPGVLDEATADLAFALMLAAAR